MRYTRRCHIEKTVSQKTKNRENDEKLAVNFHRSAFLMECFFGERTP